MFYLTTPRRKCFTLFSALDSSFNKLKSKLKHFIIPIHFPRQWFPYRKEYVIYIAVHSPKIMPPSKLFTTINQLGEYSIIYSKVENQEHPGIASCSNYDLNYKHGNFNMKSDCHLQSLIKHYGKSCHLDIMLRQSHLPYRKTQFPDESSNITKPCLFDHVDYFYKEEEYQGKCPDECHQEYYFLDIEMEEKLSSKTPLRRRSIELHLVPSPRPKITITHSREMTLMSLVCNFGGLLGIWLGVSLLDTLNYCWKIFKIIYAKLTTNNNFNSERLFKRRISFK